MLHLFVTIIHFPLLVSSGQLKTLGNGNVIITGKGCGISTPLKYLPIIPENPEEYDCVIIQKNGGKIPDDKGRGKNIWPLVLQKVCIKPIKPFFKNEKSYSCVCLGFSNFQNYIVNFM